MAATLRRLDGVYTAALVPPLVMLAGSTPEAIKVTYQKFVQRYPGVGPGAFRAINTNVLAEVGINVLLLDNRVDLTLRVDQLVLRATNIRTAEEADFIRDCVLIIYDVVRHLSPETSIGTASLNVSSWSSVDGGRAAVEKTFTTIARPPKANRIDEVRLGAKKASYYPHVLLENDAEGWQLTVSSELSAIPEADLFLIRRYVFAAGTKYGEIEQQLSFLQESNVIINDWLGVEIGG